MFFLGLCKVSTGPFIVLQTPTPFMSLAVDIALYHFVLVFSFLGGLERP